jgi:para-nitrobenzyl esterase
MRIAMGGLMLSVGALFPLAAASLTQPVKTEGGLLNGMPSADGSVRTYKGVPFAAPPVGNLRWRAPRPAAAWQGTRQANQFSASCIQNIVEERKPWTYEFMTHTPISEDCLYLNVWTGAKNPNEKRPVLFWMYGGGYTEGSAAVPVYDGEALARKGLVVVTVNYRLGLLGFLVDPELSKESDRNASGNYGTLDQIAALQWVQKNIAAFGGDPNRVTIAGQSAGAGSVHALTASPLAKGLFKRAIAESGSSVVPNGRMLHLAQAEEAGAKFAASKGASDIAALRAMSWQELVGGTRTGNASNFRPIVDGWVLPDTVENIFAQGRQNDVPTLTGLTADEGSAAPDYGTIPAAAFEKQIGQRFGDLASSFLRLYSFSGDEQAGAAEKTSAREQGRVSMYLWAVNRAKTAKTKAFTYYWTHAEPGPDEKRYGAFHTSEVPYLFNTLDKSSRPWTAEDHKIAETLGSYWANFAANGDPNGKGLASWPAFQAEHAQTMELGNRFGAIPIADQPKIDFFTQYFSRQARAGE